MQCRFRPASGCRWWSWVLLKNPERYWQELNACLVTTDFLKCSRFLSLFPLQFLWEHESNHRSQIRSHRDRCSESASEDLWNRWDTVSTQWNHLSVRFIKLEGQIQQHDIVIYICHYNALYWVHEICFNDSLCVTQCSLKSHYTFIVRGTIEFLNMHS